MLPDIIPAPAVPLESEAKLDSYLLSVATQVRLRAKAAEVAVYLVEPATRRLKLRAWATSTRAGVQSDPDTPHDLTDHGIDGSDLSAQTLRDFIHAAPRGQRIAKPLHDGDNWVGALVGIASTRFSPEATGELSTSVAELTDLLRSSEVQIAHLVVADPESSIDLPSTPIYGHSASDGISYAPALLFDTDSSRGQSAEKVEESREDGIRRLDAAIKKTREQLQRLTTDKSSELYDVVSLLFSTHVMMLGDEAFSGAMRSLVEAGQTPEDAVQSVVASFVKTFRKLREARLAETAQDVRDIGYRLLQNLAEKTGEGQDFTDRIVLVEDILPSDLVRLALGHAAGVVILGATVTAHISILAQSLGLPVLVASDRTALEIVNDTMLLLDAESGRLYPSPSPEQVGEYGFDPKSGAQCCSAEEEPAEAVAADHRTADGNELQILVNVNLLSDARRGAANGAYGIGLYRSEFPFIIRNDFINEEEQYRIYRSVVESMPGRPVTLRTADIGGDKLMAGREEERNPFLGVRGIRFSLANRDLFRRQLRAMLRAGHGADLRIMFPMVASLDEVEDAREEIDSCLEALRRDGLEHNPKPKIGAMVELPSAVIGIEELAERTDFLSIGTNDLTMYMLAVDRTNERLSELYRSHHPIVLRTLAEIASRVDPEDDDLSVCGASAADPVMIPFYLGIGIRKLSVAPRHIRATAAAAALYDTDSSLAYSSELLAIRSLRQMDEFVNEYRAPAPA